MAESSDSSGAEATESIAEEVTKESVNTNEDTAQPNMEEPTLEQIVEKPENLTEEQKEELTTIIKGSNIKIEDLPNWLRAIAYAGKNILNFISKKEYIDEKVKKYLQKDLKGKDIYVALHGIFQTYWSSFADLIKYGEEKGIIIIPIKSSSAKEIYDAISKLKEKTGANIHLIAHSRGGRYALDAVIDHSLDKLVKEIILSGTPLHNLDGTLQRKEYAEVGKKVKLTNIYGLNDQILTFFGNSNYGNLPNATNIPTNAGHLDLIHNKNIFEIYTHHDYNFVPQPNNLAPQPTYKNLLSPNLI